MTSLADLMDRWNSDEGRPYKGNLIDIVAYTKDPGNIGCMCAQGQVLHLLGGWTPERLSGADQTTADIETAKLMDISRAHAVLLRTVNDQADGAPASVLTDPGAVLGDQWAKLLDFWWYIDGMTSDQWAAAGDAAWDAAWDVTRGAARGAARDAAGIAAGGAARDAARVATRDAAGDAAWDVAGVAAGASSEIQGVDVLHKRGTPLFFLPAFGFADTDSIPARPANYGITA